jgi:hypothetical protein
MDSCRSDMCVSLQARMYSALSFVRVAGTPCTLALVSCKLNCDIRRCLVRPFYDGGNGLIMLLEAAAPLLGLCTRPVPNVACHVCR